MRSTTATVDSSGRIVLPARFRRELGVSAGAEVLVRYEDGEIRVTTRDARIRKVQELVRRYVPVNVSLVDELIAERRAEAKRELED